MNNNQIERAGNNNRALKALDEEWRSMKAALERLGQAEARQAKQTARRSGRLLFGLDLTGSREPGLRQARIATAGMLDTIKAVGAVAVKLVYYRGADECRAGEWHDDPAKVSRAMLGLSCKTGGTQISKVLRFALDEKEKLSAALLILDHCEESEDLLLPLAECLGAKGIPLFVFHEIADHNKRSLEARAVFERMAAASRGVYVEFKPDSGAGAALREMLSTVAAFSAAGHEGLKQLGQPLTPEARRLTSGLLMLSDGNPGRFDFLRPDGKGGKA